MIKTCIICKGVLIKFTKSFEYEIFKCVNCGFGVTDKAILQKGSYHRDETYIEEEKLFGNIFQKRVNILNKLAKPGRVLEIGCSTGIFLWQLKRIGWDVKGIEISKASVAAAKDKGINVITVPFEKAKLDEKFDLVILNHTLEHLKDPLQVMKKLSEIIKSGGYLYIDLPNFASLSCKILKGNWSMLLPEEHLWHFTQKSLKVLLNKNGLRMVFVDKASGIWDFADPIGGIFDSFLTLKKRFFTQIVTAIPSYIVWKLGLGSDLMVIAKKL